MKSHTEHQSQAGDKHQIWEHRCHRLQCLGSLQGHITPRTYSDATELRHLPQELFPTQGFQAAAPRHWRSHQGHSCSWGSYSRLPFPTDQIQHGVCYRLLPCVATSHCNSTIHSQQPAPSSTCPGGDPAAPAQSTGIPTGQDHKWRVSWPWTQSSLLSPLPQAKPASGCTRQLRALPTALHGTEEDQENGVSVGHEGPHYRATT